MAKRYVMQIYKGDVPLTQVETARVIQSVKEDHIVKTANLVLSEESPISRRCDNKNHNLYKKCVGGGMCLAKKYKKGTALVDQMCSTCDSKVIVEALNYIFDNFYEENYKAEWRTPRKTKRLSPERPSKKKQISKDDQTAILNSLDGPAPPRRRKKSILRKERSAQE